MTGAVKIGANIFHILDEYLLCDGREKYELGQDLVWLKWVEEEVYATLKYTRIYPIFCLYSMPPEGRKVYLNLNRLSSTQKKLED